MRFTVHKLFNEDLHRYMAFKDIESLFTEREIVSFQFGDFEYFFNPMSIEQTRCFFEIKYGKKTATDCFSKPEKQFKSNILNDNLIHTREQFFVLIDFNPEETFMYVSDVDKKNIFIQYCRIHKINIRIVDMCNDVETFIKQIKKVNSVKVKSTSGLFIKEYLNPSYLAEWDNLDPHSFSFSINYNCAIDEKIIRRQYKNLKENVYLEEVVFEGTDDDDRILQFNGNSLILKKNINIEKLDNGYFDAFEVLSKLKEVI